MRLTYKVLAQQLNDKLFLRMGVDNLEKTLGFLCRTVRDINYTTKEAKELLVKFADQEPELTVALIQSAFSYPQYTINLCSEFQAIDYLVNPALIPTDVLATDVYYKLEDVGFTEDELEAMFDNLAAKLIRMNYRYYYVEEVLMSQAKNRPDNFDNFLHQLNNDPDNGYILFRRLSQGDTFEPLVDIDDFPTTLSVLEGFKRQINDIKAKYDITEENVQTLDITPAASHNKENNGDTEMTTTTAPATLKTDERILTALSATVENIQAFDETLNVGQLYRSMWRLYYCAADQIFPDFQGMVELHRTSKVTIIGQIMYDYKDSDEFDVFLGIIKSLDFISMNIGQRETLVNLLTILINYDEVDYQAISESFFNTIKGMIRQSTMSNVDTIASTIIEQTWELKSASIYRGVINTIYSIVFYYHCPEYLAKYLAPYFRQTHAMTEVMDDQDLIDTFLVSVKLVSLSDREELIPFVRMVQHIPNYTEMFTDISRNLPSFLQTLC